MVLTAESDTDKTVLIDSVFSLVKKGSEKEIIEKREAIVNTIPFAFFLIMFTKLIVIYNDSSSVKLQPVH